ncbi:uncharacterized protein LOC143020870 [Oratosquilla oratoria]|uniref:uncharacterized protein LOC143020870 n=1 Tax=Oratosquilla oratoria TaxID=337810 RepID=UPI003F75F18E
MGFLKRIRSEVKPFFIHGEQKSDENIVVKIIQADNAYTAELSPNHDAVKQWAPKLEKTPSEYVKMLQEALDGSGDEDNKKIQNVFEIQNSYLVWRQPVAGKDIKVVLGKIPMEKEAFTEAVSTIFSDVVDELNKCREDIRKLDKERKDLHKEHKKAIAVAESSVKEKEEIERELYCKFSLLLNSKKNEIRQLKAQGPNCSAVVPDEPDAGVEASSSTSATVSRTYAANKRESSDDQYDEDTDVDSIDTDEEERISISPRKKRAAIASSTQLKTNNGFGAASSSNGTHFVASSAAVSSQHDDIFNDSMELDLSMSVPKKARLQTSKKEEVMAGEVSSSTHSLSKNKKKDIRDNQIEGSNISIETAETLPTSASIFDEMFSQDD